MSMYTVYLCKDIFAFLCQYQEALKLILYAKFYKQPNESPLSQGRSSMVFCVVYVYT